MRNFLISLLFLITIRAFSQQKTDSVLHLPELEVIAGRISAISAGIKVSHIDSVTHEIYSSVSLSRLLSDQTSAIIRSYGPGGTASFSFRGMQPSQSVILWEGINLNSPTHGTTDLSMMPVFIFDNISLQYGGGSAFSGSGALGGNLILSGKDCYEQPLKVQAKLAGGSFGNLSAALKLSIGNYKLSYSGSAVAGNSKNNYVYRNLNGNRVFLEHAHYQLISTIHKLEWKISEHQTASVAGWYQASGRDIPPTMVMTQSAQHQEDKALRTSLQWKWQKTRHLLVSGLAFTHEYMHYSDPITTTDAVYKMNSYQPNIGYKIALSPNTNLDAGVSGKVVVADVPYYNGMKKQSEAAAYATLVYYFRLVGWKAMINLRQDVVEGYKVPFCPAIGAEGRVTTNLDARVNMSRNFRVPTFNDRFWQPGGNPDLKPESSYNAEAGLIYRLGSESDQLSGKIGLAGYSAWVNDLILWVPASGSIWTPLNVEKLWSRGLEVSGLMRIRKSLYNTEITANYTWSPSTLNGSTDETDGRQLIYTPLHTLKTHLRLQFSKYLFQLNNTFQSRKFTRKDNLEWLPANALINLSAGRVVTFRKTKCTLKFDISNLLNTSYQAVQYYPAPGISFLASLTAEF